jgi:hypothetical protein
MYIEQIKMLMSDMESIFQTLSNWSQVTSDAMEDLIRISNIFGNIDDFGAKNANRENFMSKQWIDS